MNWITNDRLKYQLCQIVCCTNCEEDKTMENKLKDKTMERWNKLKDNIPSDIFCRDLQKKINEPAAIYFREEN